MDLDLVLETDSETDSESDSEPDSELDPDVDVDLDRKGEVRLRGGSFKTFPPRRDAAGSRRCARKGRDSRARIFSAALRGLKTAWSKWYLSELCISS
ncbi:hypothetical protein PG994_013195 [Apiospora phragmitis]|uniref:Uncharacterized protein n=1 Tax=Apiospora phragmitis TaxID=2905665 RepID=A0ABR1T8G7_9PEZI